MDIHHHHQKRREKLDQDQHHHQSTSKQSQVPPPPPPPSTAAPSPPSSSSSPAHEFSFTISLHHQLPADKSKPPPPPSIAVDLSPADEIFFHGHLLPLHLLSHLPASSPRSSTNSIDSFTLPLRDLTDPQIPSKTTTATTTATTDPVTETRPRPRPGPGPEPRPKSKPFSLFGISIPRKGIEVRETEEREKQRKKLKFDLNQVIKRYVRMVRPLFGGRKEDSPQLRRQPHSFSGYLSPRNYDRDLRGKRGEFSAPASMKTSPSNSGLLVGNGVVSTSTSDSTMEELQAAIQAAIAHCKNSIAVEEKIKC